MRIIFIRHGDYNKKGLTRLGKKQAKMACGELKYENIGEVYCSPCPRAKQTAEVICKALKLPAPIVTELLLERDRLKDQPQNPEEQEYYDNYLNPNFSKSHPEGCKDFLARSHKFSDSIIDKDYESLLIVGHSSFAYALCHYFMGTNKDTITWVRLGNCSKLCFDSRDRVKNPSKNAK